MALDILRRFLLTPLIGAKLSYEALDCTLHVVRSHVQIPADSAMVASVRLPAICMIADGVASTSLPSPTIFCFCAVTGDMQTVKSLVPI